MTVLKFVAYEKRAQRTGYVDLIDNMYHQQCMSDLKETLRYLQAQQDLINPGKGGGVALAANQLGYPYEPTSSTDPTPAPGFYPANYVPPNIYLVHIRSERAALEGCSACTPTFFINAVMTPKKGTPKVHSGEASSSFKGFRGLQVPRYYSITVYAQNIFGKWKRHEYSGFTARVHQHAIDFGNNKDYLQRMDFSELEMQQIANWLTTPILAINHWIVPEKLQCACTDPDITALAQWTQIRREVGAHSLPTSAVHQRVIIIAGDRGLGLAWVRHYLRNKCEVIATHKTTTELDALKVLKYKYPHQLTLEPLDLNHEQNMSEFTRKIQIKDNDLIIYNATHKGYMGAYTQLEELEHKTQVLIFLGQYMLLKYWFNQLVQNNVLWVNVGQISNRPSVHRSSQEHPCHSSEIFGLIQNINNDLSIEWNKKRKTKGIVERPPQAISAYPGWDSTQLSNKTYQPDSDQIARDIIETQINPIKQFVMYVEKGIPEEKTEDMKSIGARRQTFSIGRHSVFAGDKGPELSSQDRTNIINRRQSF